MRKTIYKIDSEGRERMVRISTQGAEVIMESGLLAGNLVENRYACTGKNVGRANETTPEQQAELEAESRIAAKLKEEYFETIEEARSQSRQVLLPMLAKDYKKEFKKVKFPCFAQPKLDGMRCLATSSTMTSRQNTPIDTMSHIQTALRLAGIGEVLDGELYAHGLSFQENMKLIKKQRVESTMVTYHVYDLVSDEPFEKRYAKLARLVEGVRNVELVPTFVINNEEDLKRYHAKFLGEGYEGTIVRWGTQGYEVNKRSSGLLKYKDFLDVACEVIDVVPSERRPEQGVAVCRFENGNTFQCGMKFPHAEREEILRNKADYIGRTAELRFFEYTDDGMPRFPVCVGFRLDK